MILKVKEVRVQLCVYILCASCVALMPRGRFSVQQEALPESEAIC